MSSIRGRPFTVGSDFPANKKTEIYKQESDKWETMQDFPFAKISIERYGIASTHSKGSTYCFSSSLVIQNWIVELIQKPLRSKVELQRSSWKVVFSFLVGFMTATGISSSEKTPVSKRDRKLWKVIVKIKAFYNGAKEHIVH